MRRLALAVALLLTLLAPCAHSAQPPLVGLPAGCNARNVAQSGPYYLAVNDPCLGANAAIGDARSAPGAFWMQSGTPDLYIAATASIDVTASITAGQTTLTVSPCILRAEWGGGLGVPFRLTLPGAGASATIATNGITLSGNSVLNVASGGTAASVGDVITDNPSSPGSGGIPAGTTVIGNSATTITLSNPVTAQIANPTTITYYAPLANAQGGTVAGNKCSMTLGAAATTTLTNLPVTIAAAPNSQNEGGLMSTILSGSWTLWRHTPVMLSGNTLTISTYQAGTQGAFVAGRDVTLGTSLWAEGGQKTTVVIHDPTSACPDQAARIVASTPTVATLDRVLKCPLTTANAADIYWGTLVATPAYFGNLTLSAGTSGITESIEVQGVGSGSTAAVPVPLDTTVLSVTDYLHAVLAVNAGATSPVAPLSALLLWGHDDTNSVLAAACQVAGNIANLTQCPNYTASTAVTQGFRGLYWPPGIQTFMASVGVGLLQVSPTPVGPVDPLMQVQRYGEGGLIWERSSDWMFNTSPIDGPRWIPNRTLFASQSLIQARSAVSGGHCAVFGGASDSWLVPGISADSLGGSPTGALADAILDQNTACPPTYIHYDYGGTVLAGMDPLGPNLGFGVGIPANTAAGPDWYQAATTESVSSAPTSGSPTLTFASAAIASTFYPGATLTDTTTAGVIPTGAYVKTVSGATVTMSANATATGTASDSITGKTATSQWMTLMMMSPTPVDTWIMRHGVNDAFRLLVPSIEDVVGTTQQAAWNTNAGRYPDWVFMPGINPPQGGALATEQGEMIDAGLERSIALSGYLNGIMHNGGSVGSVDAARATLAGELGWDPVDLAPTNAGWVLPDIGANLTSTLGLPFYFFEPLLGYGISFKLLQSGSLSASTFYGNFGGGWCGAVGAGALMMPGTTAGQTGTTDAYTGGAFCVDRNASTGNLNISRFLYRVSKTGTCSYTSTTGVLACSSAIINMGFAGGVGFDGSTPKKTAAAMWVCGVGIGSTTGPAFVGSPTNCIQGAIAAGGVSSNGRNVTFASTGLGSTVASEAVSVLFYRLQPGDPTDIGCQPYLHLVSGQTYELVYFNVDPAGRVSVSDGLNSQFEEQGLGCQWQGYMAGFFGTKYYPSIFSEDNATHAGFAVETSNGVTGANFWEYDPSTSRLTASYTPEEAWGDLNYVGPSGGAGYGHASGKGSRGNYGGVFRAQDWGTK